MAARMLAGAVLLALTLTGTAETGTRKKPVAEETATPAPNKKAHPKATLEPATEPADTVAGRTEVKPKTTRLPAAPAKTKKAEPDREAVPAGKPSAAATVSIAPEELVEFHAQPAGVRKLIEFSLGLARQNLTYSYGSADPAKGGMDCSGFIYYALRQYGLTQVPRDSSGQYVWIRHTRGFRAVIGRKPDSFELDELLPGDLLFWIGTYATENDPPISHVMIYLGTEKASGSKVMVGSSDGRTYRGQKRNGVSVFDFTMPRTPANGDPRPTFVGYGRIPGLRD